MLAAAENAGFKTVLGDREGAKEGGGGGGFVGVEERRVERWMIERGLVDARRGEKWARGGVNCWFGVRFRCEGF